MAKFEDLSESIVAINRAIADAKKNKKVWDDHEAMYEVFVLCHKTYWSQVHEYYYGLNNDKGEQGARQCVQEVKTNILPLILDRVKKVYSDIDLVSKYLMLLDDFECLVAYRDLQQYAICLEKDLPNDKQIITMATQNELIQPILYTSQQMILTGNVKKLFKNTPTGYFKSYSDVIIISWILGYNYNGDCLKVVGNPTMVTKTINGVSAMMLKEKYAKIFPFYKQFNCDKNLMFEILAPRAGEMKVSNTYGIDFSLMCISKDTSIDGGRYKYRFYDDITNSKYKVNITMHDKDDASYNDQWKKRRYTEFDDCEWFTGTVYFYLDFLSRRRNENGFSIAKPLKQFRYTKFCAEKKSVFVVIPKLDYETDECTFPQIYSTEQARIDRSNDFETFQAMEQGLPTIPDGMPFDYSNMKVWKELPLKESEGGNRSDYSMAVLDLPRTGDNNLSLLIFSKCGDLYYLVDAIYQKKKLDLKLSDNRTMLDVVCDKIRQKSVKHLLVETNVCSNIKTQLEDKLGSYSCKIQEIYSTRKKEDKIFDAQSDIQQHIVIPANGIFGLSSDVGKAVFEIVTWNKSAKSDDSADCCAMFVNEYIGNSSMAFASVRTFKR
jgi:hypothetical protein